MTTLATSCRRILPLVLLCLVAAVPSPAGGKKAPPTLGAGDLGVLVTADPGGGMRVFWNPPEETWPAGGYRVERLSGHRATVIAEGLFPGSDTEALARLDEKDREGLARAGEAFRRGEPIGFAGGVLFLSALRDFDFARALGIACVDPSPPTDGSFRYRVSALDASGRVLARGTTVKVRAGQEAPLPPAPTDVTVSASREGMTVRWRNRLPAEEGQAPAVLFLVLRRDARAPGAKPVGNGPALLQDGVSGAFLDREPPVATTVEYSVVPLDPFGRRGPASEPVEAWSPDWKALAPPPEVVVQAGPGAVRVSWQADANPHRKGWIVARATGAHGPFEPLVEEPLAESSFRDREGTPGAVYWYAVRAVDERGLEGEWAVSRAVRFLRAAPIPPPVDLEATASEGRVELRWRPGGKERLAGWIVERATGKDGAFRPLHRGVTAGTRFVDRYPRDLGGLFRYRVVAVGPGGDRSDPSAVVEVPLPDTRPPAPPRIVRADGLGGGVHLAWEAGARDPGLAGWLVLRSPLEDALGEVLTPEPLPVETTEFHDTGVAAGDVRYYRVVAVDAAGNRSEPAGPVAVRATPLPLPVPPRPAVKLAVSPHRHAVLHFPAPDRPDVRWAVQRRTGDGPWVRIAGPLPADATTARDDRLPPAGTKVAWRLVALGSDGRPGPAGPEAALPE